MFGPLSSGLFFWFSLLLLLLLFGFWFLVFCLLAFAFAGIRVAVVTLICLATLVWFLWLCAGIRVLFCLVHALPLCGAALTFFAAAKKVSKESGLTPQALVLA
ncbi:hypothetical protein [Burkholderia sp. Ac-20365]|uniref:hypothetical protein n=1 Tax=Burkholderia sp. Ac-20365 TaxID=2703897 RepID=UPI00197CA114|nr:hypothetical protein [Burkholderia sp. Ac-20365]MBN3766519.1 hypothetical protein [Burkholderia sp. Ac-20365]